MSSTNTKPQNLFQTCSSQSFQIVNRKTLGKLFPKLKRNQMISLSFNESKFNSPQRGKSAKSYLIGKNLSVVFEINKGAIGPISEDIVFQDRLNFIAEQTWFTIAELRSQDAGRFQTVNKDHAEQVVPTSTPTSVSIYFKHPLTEASVGSCTLTRAGWAAAGDARVEVFYPLASCTKARPSNSSCSSSSSSVGPELPAIRMPFLQAEVQIRGKDSVQASLGGFLWHKECQKDWREPKSSNSSAESENSNSCKTFVCCLDVDNQTKVKIFFKRADPKTRQKSSGGEYNLLISKLELSANKASDQMTNKKKERKFADFYKSLKGANLSETMSNYRFRCTKPVLPQRCGHPEPHFLSQSLGQNQQNENSFLPTPSEGFLCLEKLLSPLDLDFLSDVKSLQDLFDLEGPYKLAILQKFKEKARQKLMGKADIKISQEFVKKPGALLNHIKNRELCSALQTVVSNLATERDADTLDLIVAVILENLVEVGCDVYGNFVLQILLLKLSKSQILLLLVVCSQSLPLLFLDPRGIFSAQKLIECLKDDEERNLFLRSVQSNMTLLMSSQQAGFVLKKLIQDSPIEASDTLAKTMTEDFLEIASDKYGICVVKFLLKRFENDYYRTKSLAEQFLLHIRRGKSSSHFNFGIQHLLEVVNKNKWVMEPVEAIISSFFKKNHRPSIRSKAIGQTIVLMAKYHRTEFTNSIVYPVVCQIIEEPSNQVELQTRETLANELVEYSRIPLKTHPAKPSLKQNSGIETQATISSGYLQPKFEGFLTTSSQSFSQGYLMPSPVSISEPREILRQGSSKESILLQAPFQTCSMPEDLDSPPSPFYSSSHHCHVPMANQPTSSMFDKLGKDSQREPPQQALHSANTLFRYSHSSSSGRFGQ